MVWIVLLVIVGLCVLCAVAARYLRTGDGSSKVSAADLDHRNLDKHMGGNGGNMGMP